MTAFDLETKLVDAGFDLHAMRKEWKELSQAKNWPETEEGWRRYLDRIHANGKGPKAKAEKVVIATVVPPAFIEWWKSHQHAGYRLDQDREEWSISPLLGWRCMRYWREYHDRFRVLKEAA